MQKSQTSYLTYGAMMVALFAILLTMSVYVPFVGLITSFIVPLPIAWYSIKFERKHAAIVTVISIVISLLISGIIGLVFALLVAPLGFIIGDSIRNKRSKIYIMMGSALFLLLMTAVQYILSILLLNINFMEQFLQVSEIYYEQVESMMSSVGQLPDDYYEQVEKSKLLIKTIMPSYFIVSVFILNFMYLIINLSLLKKLKVEVPKFSKFMNFRLPKVVLWYYLIVSVFSIFVTYEIGSFGYLASANALLILRFLLFLQGVSFIHYYFNIRGYSKWATILVTFLSVPLYTFIVILGVFDLGFNLRNYINDRYKK